MDRTNNEGIHRTMSTNGSGDSKQTLTYRPVKFNAGQILPDLPVGEFQAVILPGKVKVKPMKAGYPMLTVNMRVTGAADEENAHYTGSQTTARVIFWPDAAGFKANASKRTLANLCEQAGVDLDIIPSEISSDEDLLPLCQALEGQNVTIWTSHRTNAQTNETQVEVSFRAPPGGPAKRNDD